ncbi:MAG TPA: ATP-dependent DNA ligase [Usitatibacter sp.]|jgi:DNA ligase-1|nr:ATP-dependent DNA ligase [Usitatibacter sp.]
MKRFAELFERIDSSTSTKAKTQALADYFRQTPALDAAWAAWFLTGHRPRQAVPTRRMVAWASEMASLPPWLFEESYDAVGDLAETIALILPPAERETDLPLAAWVEERLVPLRELAEAEQRARLEGYWRELDGTQRFVFNKLITGNFRVGVSALLVMRAIAQAFDLDPKLVAHRLAGEWWPGVALWSSLVEGAALETRGASPYPFFLAHPLENPPESLGAREEWLAEWKWDGIRAQLIRRGDVTALWSRGDEPIAHQFPEIMADAARLPHLVIDGEILAWKDGRVMPFAALQKRLGRKNPGKKVMADSPAIFLAFDLLEWEGEDWRARPLAERREKLAGVIHSIPGGSAFDTSSQVRAPTWETLALARQQSREMGTEGLMLKRLASAYGVGRPRGDWWKWKIEPYTLDAVLIYAQKGHGKRASLYTDYTFGIWKDGDLVPFAKAYSGLTDEEIREVDAFIRRNTLERFGPVRTVKPELVFELGFEGIQRSTRHKSGIAVRFPRMLRMRKDKAIREANTLEDALELARL